MTNRNSVSDGHSGRRPTRWALLAIVIHATMIVGCAEKSASEPRVDAAAAKALRVKLLGDEAPGGRAAE